MDGGETGGDDALRATYLAETGVLLRRRLHLTVVLFLALVGVSVVLEGRYHPERARLVAITYAGEVAACLLAVTACRLRIGRPAELTALLGATLSILMTWYSAAVGGDIERIATGQVCLLSGLVVLMPWGWRPQLFVAGAVLVGAVAVAGPRVAAHTATAEAFNYTLLAVTTGAVTSVCGALFLDRYRYHAFVRTALLVRGEAALTASKQHAEEEAEIAAVLQHVGETLSEHLNAPDMLVRVTRLAIDALGCDFGTTYIWHEERQAFRLAAAFGVEPEVYDEVAQIDFTFESMPVVRAMQPGTLVEIADAQSQSLVPPELLARWHTSSQVLAPIPRRQQVIGVLGLGYRQRTGPFSPRQRRLALGIAHATAIALENARLIADLRAASQLKTEFVSTMSHELRTPLNVILGFAEMHQDPDTSDADRTHAIRRIETAGRELLDLIESTLEVGKLEAGREDVRLEPVSLPMFWSRLGESCEGLPHRDGVALEWNAEVPDVALVTDPRKLTIVLRNLVGNALKFTERGWVRAGAHLADDSVVITVADTGIGIRAEDHQTIFDMFRQADGSDSRRFGGTGLGLYIVRRFVAQLGGAIMVDSTPGSGSVFTIAIPRSTETPPVSRAA